MDKFHRKKKFLNQPKYPEGKTGLRDFIGKNLKYPTAALENKTEGTVQVRYTIGRDGKVIEAKAISKIGSGCDEEAIRLVKLLRYEMPKNRGLKTLFHRTIQIHFHLPKKKEKKEKVQAQTVRYHYKETKGKGASYGYTINI